jgi:hypothetical protein
MPNCIELDKRNEIEHIHHYINNSPSNWYIIQYIDTDDKNNANHLERAIRRGLEEHIEDLKQNLDYLQNKN